MRLDAQVHTAIGTIGRRMMLYDGSYYYLWNKGKQQGIKLSTADMAAYGNTAEGPTTVAGIDQVVGYECTSKDLSPSIFEPPSGVSFIEFEETL